MKRVRSEATNWHRQLTLAAFSVAAIILAYTLLYQWAIATFVGVEKTFFQSLQTVVEIVTTAGFGGGTDLWQQSDAVAFLVTVMNLSAVLLIFVAVPLFVVPLLREAFETRPPTHSNLTDHIIIAGYSEQDEVLRAELEAVDVPYLYVRSDTDLVTELNEQGLSAIVGDPESVDAYRAANAEHARALVADIDDETNPAVVLSARQVNPDLRTISVIRKPEVETYHRYAGADEIVSARTLLGKSLGLRAAGSYAEKLRQAIKVDTDLQVTGLLIEEGSDLVGQTFRGAEFFDRVGATVIGAWIGGKFVVAPDPDTVIEANTILLVAGEYDEFSDGHARPIPAHEDDEPRVVVCGYGTVGQSIVSALETEGMATETIDIENKPGVDIVGDITDPTTFEAANVADARAVVLSLDEDTPTIYATLILNQMAPEVEIVARADGADSVQKLYNAGADFVLSLPNVTGEILASHLIEEAEILTPDTDFEFVRATVPALVGQDLGEIDLRGRTGCTVVAVERDDDVLTDIGATFTIEGDDVLIIAGSEQARERFAELVESLNGGDATLAGQGTEGVDEDPEMGAPPK